ncbi:MAG: ATP-binding protein [Verrucomicrobiota bacterium]
MNPTPQGVELDHLPASLNGLPSAEIDQLVLDSLMNHITDHVYFKDRDSRFVRINQGMVGHFGLNDVSEAVGKSDFDYFSDRHAKCAFDDEQRIIETGEPIINKVEHEVWPDRTDTWVATTKMPWRNKDGEIIGVFGISKDITEQQKLAIKLEEKTQQLEISNQELEQFAFIASHDLQEPLRMISGFVQLIQRRYKEKLDDRGQEYIRFTVEGAQRMQALIDGLLQYSRVKTRAANKESVDCSVVFAEVVCNLQRIIKEVGAQVEFDGDLPVINGVTSQISQVFQNLLANSIKFRRQDVPLVIKINVWETDRHYEIGFSDNGIGFDPQYCDRIFGMFQRLHTRQEYEGNGIGLAMVKRIIGQHGGSIRVESEPGKGTQFYITFPKST